MGAEGLGLFLFKPHRVAQLLKKVGTRILIGIVK